MEFLSVVVLLSVLFVFVPLLRGINDKLKRLIELSEKGTKIGQ
jgi:hypothetical protein